MNGFFGRSSGVRTVSGRRPPIRLEPTPRAVPIPFNEAFERLPADQLASLLEDEDRLTQLLDNHIAFELVPTEEMEAGDLETIQGVHEVDQGGDPVTIDGARIVEADMVTSNGIVHAIDGVLTVLCRRIGTGKPQCADLLAN